MKKTIALILAAVTVLAMLAGCEININTGSGSGSNNNDNQTATQAATQAPVQEETQAATQAPTQSQQNTQAGVGDILDTPEVTFDLSIEDLYIYYTYPGETENEILSMELAVDQVTEDTYVIYMSDGLLKLDEVIYEVSDTGIAKYYKDVFAEGFTLETALSASALQAEVDSIMELFSMFMCVGEEWASAKFQKTNDFAFSLTGDVYTYDLIENGVADGKVWIDVATGLVVKIIDTDGTDLFSVQEIKTSNIDIPDYK